MKEAFTVIFLVDDNPPQKTIMLKRASWKKFAPNYYTGIGGTIENESALENAYRELFEETGIDSLQLIEFARCFIEQQDREVYYYWGIFPDGDLPVCTEGDLEWMNLSSFREKEIIPTTMMVMEEWGSRGFVLDRPFVVYARPVGGGLERELIRVEEGF